jgi:hypothetical protein
MMVRNRFIQKLTIRQMPGFIRSAGASLCRQLPAVPDGAWAGTGALLLFGSVQLTMFISAIWHGERFSWRNGQGFIA